jgi:hypothetical protein
MLTMDSDDRMDAVEVTIPLAESRTGTYRISRDGAVHRVA